jgi:uncharacterized protein YbjT (DUF2867 family)
MLKIIFKVLLGLVVILAGLVGYLYMDLRANLPESTYDLPPPLAVSQDQRPVLIFGATRNTGLELARLLRARGDSVTAAVRASSDRSALESLGVNFVVADALDADAVRAAVASDDFRAVFSSMSCAQCDPPVDAVGNINVTEGAKAAGVPRVILISTIGAGDSYESANLLSRQFLKKILPLKTEAENHLKASGLDYTIVRPGGLVPAPGTGRGYLSEDRKAFGFLSREDLARMLVAVLDDPGTINKTFAAADPEIMTPFETGE